MSLKNFQYDALMRAYNQKQLRHQHEQAEHIRQAGAQIPRLGEIPTENASLSLTKARLLLGAQKGEDFDLSKQIGQLSKERTELLVRHGYPADYLEMPLRS